MKIIKQGRNPEEREYQGECAQCETVVQFNKSEGKITSDQRDGDFISVDCPTCKHRIHVDLKKYLSDAQIAYAKQFGKELEKD